ncbi:hypothetical protein [Achromobacter marplatensis]|uniref:Uncharacterized protein n=1 Tax=Achromobacter marplatensis TaxID=470868 RepID=A0AA43AYL3_9BURK|nr:hypothetical protein [Achromobacter marplatensis]MDH2051201.1 hypothetical protein [Achromobacter marplatensis]
MNDENKTALLSKLRAEGVQAGDERADDAVTLLGKYKALCIEIGRGDSYHLGRIDAAIAALASAPVAGEARLVGYIHPDTLAQLAFPMTPYREVPLYRVHRPHVEFDAKRPAGLVPIFTAPPAAPQASEAVRIHNDAIKAAAKVCTDTARQYDPQNNQEHALASELYGAAVAIRKLEKDGGDCAKGAGDEDERLAFEAWAATEVPAHKLGRAPWPHQDQYNWASMDYAWSMWRKIRAAPSPTQPTEQGERDANRHVR